MSMIIINHSGFSQEKGQVVSKLKLPAASQAGFTPEAHKSASLQQARGESSKYKDLSFIVIRLPR